MGKTNMGDPFVSFFPSHLLTSDWRWWIQVGPVLDHTGNHEPFKGQYISAGYAGHSMPRAFTWYVLSQTFKSPTSDRLCVISSLQIVVDMIMCDKAWKKWDSPKWLPHRYLTENILDSRPMYLDPSTLINYSSLLMADFWVTHIVSLCWPLHYV